ncbi:hypothetical protein Tco_0212885 [Tanacetum coccineum]
MSSASSAVTYTSVYTDSKPGRVFWGADEEISDGDPEEPQTPPVPQDEDKREPMLIQAHDPDYPLPPVDSPTAELPGYVAESDPESDGDDETEDDPVDYPMDGGDDRDDYDSDSSGDDANDEDEDEEDEEEEEHPAPAYSVVVVSTIEPVSPPGGTEPIIPPPSTDISTTGARITIRLQASISLPPEAKVERLLAMITPSPSLPISLSPPSAGERLARCTTPPAHSSPPHVPSPLLPSSRYQANPKEYHLIAVKRIFSYLKGTPSLGLWYPKCLGFDLKGYSDSDYAECNMDKKSTSCACQLLGGKLVCWSAKKQQFVAMSLAKAEYVAAAMCYANILWMKSQLSNYDIIYEKCCLREAFTRSPNQYKEYLVEFWYTAKVLKDSTKVWFSTPTGVRDWFPTIGYGGAIKATGTLKKGLLPPRWRLLMAQIIRWQDCFHNLSQQQDTTQSVRDELEIVQTKAGTEKDEFNTIENEANNIENEVIFDKDEFNTSPDLSRSDDATKEIKLEDLSKLVKDVDVDFMDLYSPKYDEPIIIEDNEDEESPNLKLEKEKAKAEAEVAFLSAQPSYPNVEQLTELVKSLQPELSKLLTNHDFCASIPTKLKEPPSKFNEIIGLAKQVPELKKQKLEVRAGLLTSPRKVSSITAYLFKLKTLDSLTSLLNKVTEALNMFAQAIEYASQTTCDTSVPSVGQASTHPAEGEKNTKQATITQLFQQRTAKDAAKANLSKEPIPTTTTVIPPTTSPIIIPITIQLQSPFLSSPSKTTSQSKREHVKKYKGNNVMSLKDAEEKEAESDSEIEVRLSEQINEKKKIEQSVKDDLAKKEVELGREELVDLLGIDVVTNMYKAKMKYDKYCDNMMNRRALGKIKNYDVLSRGKGPITLKVYKDGGSNETIPNFKANDLHLSEWREVMQDPIIKLNDLARKKRKHADDIHDYFRSTKRYKSLVQYKDHPTRTMLNEPCLGMILSNSHQRQDFVTIKDFGDFTNEMLYIVQEIFFRLHQGPGQDDHARTFSSFLLAEVDKRNKNPHKQMRAINN